jgi:hypothetical protein
MLPMIKSIPHEVVVDTLLNSLAAERYVRGPLLLTLIDELGASDALRPAADVARDVLARVEAKTLTEADFARHVDAIRGLVHGRTASTAA